MRQDPLGAWDKTAHCRAWLQGQFWPFQMFSGNKLREVWVDDPASLMEGGSHWLAGLIEMDWPCQSDAVPRLLQGHNRPGRVLVRNRRQRQ